MKEKIKPYLTYWLNLIPITEEMLTFFLFTLDFNNVWVAQYLNYQAEIIFWSIKNSWSVNSSFLKFALLIMFSAIRLRRFDKNENRSF